MYTVKKKIPNNNKLVINIKKIFKIIFIWILNVLKNLEVNLLNLGIISNYDVLWLHTT